MNKRLYKVTTGFIHADGNGYDALFDNYKIIAVDAEEAIEKAKTHESFNKFEDDPDCGKEVIESVEIISSITVE